MTLIAHLKALFTVVFGSLKEAFRRLLLSPDDRDLQILPSDDLESGVLNDEKCRIPCRSIVWIGCSVLTIFSTATTLIQMFFETIFGSRCLTFSEPLLSLNEFELML